MPKHLNLINQRFGRLVVKSFNHRSKYHSHWLCICDCKNIKVIRGNDLKTGRTVSCGCFGKERRHEANTTHGMTKTPTHMVWIKMIQRCENPKNKDYPRYGGRGITVCNRWLNSFQAFFEDMGEKPKDLTLERINNNGNYDPDNCKWATRKEQMNNTSKNVLLTINNKTHNIAQWERIRGFNKDTIGSRIRAGWTHERAIMTPVR